MRIVCVREEKPTALGIVSSLKLLAMLVIANCAHQIVPANSATIDGYNVEQIGVPEDHQGMARYATRLNIGYKRICSVLNELVEDEQKTLISARKAWVTSK
jgi:hypothetical protein